MKSEITIRRIGRAAIALGLIVLAGCSNLSKRYPEQRRFRLTVPAAKAVRAAKGARPDTVLRVSRFSGSELARKVEFVYRTGENTWDTDFYNVFLLPPVVQVTEESRAYLAKTGLFGHVVSPGSHLDPTHALEGNLRAIYGDFRDGSAPVAVLKIEFSLIDVRATAPRAVLHEVYEIETPINAVAGEPTSSALVAAWDAALEQALRNFTGKLAAVMPAAGAATGAGP